MDKVFKLKMTDVSVSALWHCMFNFAQPKGNVESRTHSKITKAIRADCCDSKKAFLPTSTLTLDEDRYKYVKSQLREMMEKGIGGHLAEGCVELLDSFDDAEKEQEKSEEKKAE
jgi:hypothetical protein